MRSSQSAKELGRTNGECDTEIHVTATDATRTRMCRCVDVDPSSEYLLSLRDSKHISSTKGPNGATSC